MLDHIFCFNVLPIHASAGASAGADTGNSNSKIPLSINFKKRPRTYKTDKNSPNHGPFINYGTFSQFNSFLNLVLLLCQSKSQFCGQD